MICKMFLIHLSAFLVTLCQHTNDCKRRIDEKAGRDVLLLPPGWERPTAQQLANIVRMFKCAHPLRKGG